MQLLKGDCLNALGCGMLITFLEVVIYVVFFCQWFISLLTSVRKNRFWFSLLVGVDWWDVVGCTQRAAEEGIGKDVQIIKSCYYLVLLLFLLGFT